MFKPSASDKKERSLVEIVIIIVLLAILMMSFIYYFFKQEDQLTKVAFNQMQQNFSTKITTVHAQWFMDKQPTTVLVALPKENQKVQVNKKGWIDSISDKSACYNIWQQVMMEPLVVMNQPIAIVEVKNVNMSIGRICQYELPKGEFFEYNSHNGQVSRIQSRKVEY